MIYCFDISKWTIPFKTCLLEEGLFPCDDTIPILSCTSETAYKCENLFNGGVSGGTDYWGGYLNKNWVNTKINFDKVYLIKSVMIHQYPKYSSYWTKDVSLQFANDMKSHATLHDTVGWNEITVSPHTISNYLNITLKGGYGSDDWVAINEIKILGCRTGTSFTLFKK